MPPELTPPQEPNPGTTTPTNEPVGPNPLDRRAAAFAGIEESRRQIIRDSLKEAGIDEDPFDAPAGADTAAGGDGADPAPPVTEPADEPPAVTEPPPADASAAPPKRKLKIDGVEVEVTQDELEDSFRKNRAADQRLEHASRMLESVNQMQERLRQPAPAESNEPAPAAAPGDKPGATSERARELAKTLLFSTNEDEVAAALEKALHPADASKGAPSIDAILPEVEARIRSSLEWTNAANAVASENAELFKDPMFQHTAGQVANALLRQAMESAREKGEPRPEFLPVMRRAVEITKENIEKHAKALGYVKPEAPPPNEKPNGATEPTISVSTRERVDLKRSSSQLPVGRTTSRTAAPTTTADPADRVAASSATILEMRKARHQA